jgi:hypothetical protein
MRIGPYPVSHRTAALPAQLSQTVSQAASYRSSPTERPVEPVHAVQDHTTLRRVGPHTFDIHV